MTHACCPDCRLRVTTASPGEAPSCPACGESMVRAPAAETMGFRLVHVWPSSAAAAQAVALPVPPDPRP